MKVDKPGRQGGTRSGAAIALVVFFLFLILFGALILRYALGMSLRDKYLRGPAQGIVLHLPDASA